MQADKQDVLKRLAYIEGHLRGIRRMVEDDQYCVDILKQTHAVKRALDRFDEVLLRGHLNGCVREGFADGRGDQVVAELQDLFALAHRQ
jgi:CsoR family transcriptional regulator, copper-sensing transcriptional repressor